MLTNLVENAVKYCDEGGRRHGERPPCEDGEAVHILVKDSGPGIAAKHLPRLFERFYRVDPGRSRERGGTGLGLSIVKHLCEAMGGTVSVESQPGRGSTFTVELPDRASLISLHSCLLGRRGAPVAGLLSAPAGRVAAAGTAVAAAEAAAHRFGIEGLGRLGQLGLGVLAARRELHHQLAPVVAVAAAGPIHLQLDQPEGARLLGDPVVDRAAAPALGAVVLGLEAPGRHLDRLLADQRLGIGLDEARAPHAATTAAPVPSPAPPPPPGPAPPTGISIGSVSPIWTITFLTPPSWVGSEVKTLRVSIFSPR